MYTIKKTGPKAFHLGNRLNGNAADNHAKYGIFNAEGEQVGFVSKSGVWSAYMEVEGKLRPIGYSTSTLEGLKVMLANYKG